MNISLSILKTQAALQRLRLFVRFVPFDTQTSEGRSHERYRRALISGLASAFSSGINIASLLISIPLTIGYLGVERFGVWMTISSFSALLAFADMGLGNGLMNAVAAAHGREDANSIRKYISSAFLVLGGVTLFFIGAFYLADAYVSWHEILAVPPGKMDGELNTALAIFVLCFALNIPLSIVQRVQMGLQMGYAASLWQMVAALVGLIALLAVIAGHGGLQWLVAANFGTPLVVSMFNGLVFWCKFRPDLKPSFRIFHWKYANKLMQSGFLFFVLQAMSALAFASDNIIIAHLFGQAAVAQYSVVSRLFESMLMALSVFIIPLWPAYAEAAAREDYGWIQITLIKTIQLTFVVLMVGVLLLVVCGKFIVHLWVGDHIEYSLLLFAGYGLWALLKGHGNTLAMFLNGLNVIGYQTILSVIFALAATIAKFYFGVQLGLVGIPLALILSYVVFIVIPYCFLLPKILQRITTDPT